ncbi:MAG: hypothetical protein QM589_05240 [Thermomicrobiales bacterium]
MTKSFLQQRIHGARTLAVAAILTGTIATAIVPGVSAQASAADPKLVGQMAAITLDQSTLPDGYTLVGEAFLDADHAGYANIDAKALTDGGFLGRYVSYYENTSQNGRIVSYVSAWSSEDAAKAGFDLTEDEAKTSPDATLTDSDASVGDEPRELTTGTFKDGDSDIGTADITFRSGTFLVGVDVEKTDGSQPDTSVAETLAKTAADRAGAVTSGNNPQNTDLALALEALPLSSLGTGIQTGFLTPTEVENVYGVQGSSLSKLTASWTETIAVGADPKQVPYITVGLTTFANADEAKAVVSGAADLTPSLANLKAVDNVSVEGADSAAAFTFTSSATGATDADSYRILVSKGTLLIVVDVQGAPSVDLATETATGLVKAQLGCVGQDSCPAPTLPSSLAG